MAGHKPLTFFIASGLSMHMIVYLLYPEHAGLDYLSISS
jgi:hypothetical protein